MALAITDRFGHGGVDLTVFDPSLHRPDDVARGFPYRADPMEPLLNAPAHMMSIRTGDPDDFLRWYRRASPYSSDGDVYVTRPTFGQYLSDSFHDLRQRWGSRDGVLHCVPEEVVDLVRADDGSCTLSTPHGSHYGFDYVALCIGWSSSADTPAGVSPAYPLRPTIREALQQPTVAVVGTGLAAIDVVRALLISGYRGRITLGSRFGLLPAIRSTSPSPTLKVLTPRFIEETEGLDLQRLLDLIEAEADANGIDVSVPRRVLNQRHPRIDVADYLRRSRDERWAALFVAICDECGPALWNKLDKSSRRAFRSILHRFFQAWCNPMPPQTGDLVLEALDSGSLVVRNGLAGFDARTLHFVDGAEERFGMVIDAARNASEPLASQDSKLVRSLLARREAVADAFGGLTVRFGSWSLVNPKESTIENVYAIGSLTQGTRYYVNALDSILRTVDEAVEHILAARRATPVLSG